MQHFTASWTAELFEGAICKTMMRWWHRTFCEIWNSNQETFCNILLRLALSIFVLLSQVGVLTRRVLPLRIEVLNWGANVHSKSNQNQSFWCNSAVDSVNGIQWLDSSADAPTVKHVRCVWECNFSVSIGFSMAQWNRRARCICRSDKVGFKCNFRQCYQFFKLSAVPKCTRQFEEFNRQRYLA